MHPTFMCTVLFLRYSLWKEKSIVTPFSDSPLCISIDNSMFQLSPNKETGIGDCCHVNVNGQMDVICNMCCLLCVVFWL